MSFQREETSFQTLSPYTYIPFHRELTVLSPIALGTFTVYDRIFSSITLPISLAFEANSAYSPSFETLAPAAIRRLERSLSAVSTIMRDTSNPRILAAFT